MKRLIVLPIMTISLLLGACASNDEKSDIDEPGALDLILCEQPRPEVCTHEYDPVCGTLIDGSNKTGSTACTSCSDSSVVGYRSGACKT